MAHDSHGWIWCTSTIAIPGVVDASSCLPACSFPSRVVLRQRAGTVVRRAGSQWSSADLGSTGALQPRAQDRPGADAIQRPHHHPRAAQAGVRPSLAARQGIEGQQGHRQARQGQGADCTLRGSRCANRRGKAGFRPHALAADAYRGDRLQRAAQPTAAGPLPGEIPGQGVCDDADGADQCALRVPRLRRAGVQDAVRHQPDRAQR